MNIDAETMDDNGLACIRVKNQQDLWRAMDSYTKDSVTTITYLLHFGSKL